MSMSDLKPRSISDISALLAILGTIATGIYVCAYQQADINYLKSQSSATAIQDLRERMARVETKLDIALNNDSKGKR